MATRPRKRKSKKKKVMATNIDQAYMLYMKMYDNKPPTASRFKKFINDDKRVQMDPIDFVTCNQYLIKTGKGRSSSTNIFISSPLKKHKSKRKNSYSDDTKNPLIPKKKHYKSSKSVDYKDGKRKNKKFGNKSRAEQTISISALTKTKNIKNRKNKYLKTSHSHTNIHSDSSKIKKILSKKASSKKLKKGKSKKEIPPTFGTSKSEFIAIPNDDELMAILSEIPNEMSPLKTSTNLLQSFPFFEHMSMKELDLLQINDKIDHRHVNGQYLTAQIVSKNGSKIKLKYDRINGSKKGGDIWSDFKYEFYKFAKYHSISLRPAHRMMDVQIGSFVDINPRRMRKKAHQKWQNGEILVKDYKSGQVKVEYLHKSKKFEWWTHLDNVDEIAPFSTMKIMKKEETKKIAMFNMDLKQERSGYHDDDEEECKEADVLKLDYLNLDKWTNKEVIYWFDTIENGKFGSNEDERYKELMDAISKWNVCGSDLLQINNVFLKMLGVNDENDRNIILKNIKRIAPKLPKTNGHKNGYKETKKLKSDISKLQEANNKISADHKNKLSELKDLQKLYSRLQKESKNPSKEVMELQQKNQRIAEKLQNLQNELQQKNDKISSMEEQIVSLNNEINQKHEKNEQIQSELSIMTSKYDSLYIEHSKQHKLLRSFQQNKSRPEQPSNIYIVDKTKDSESEIVMNGNGHYDDTKEAIFDHPKSNKTTPITPFSDTASVQSVNSASEQYIESDDDETSISPTFDNGEVTIVIDNGSETLKIGYSKPSQTNHRPTKKFHSILGRPRNKSILSNDDWYFGDDAYSKSSILDLSKVVHRGNVTDWDKMEKLWEYTFRQKLHINSEDGSLSNYDLLLTESLNRSDDDRQKSVQIMFETFDLNSMYMQNEAVLSLYGTGKMNGCVLGIGYGVTYSSAIYEGQCIPASVIRVNSAGYDISQYFKQLLGEKYCTMLKNVRHSVIKDIKQKHCFVADNFHYALKQNANSYKKYKLPDGQNLRVGNERFRASEQLFGGFINLNNEEMSRDTKKLFNKGAAFNNSGIQHMVNESIRCIDDVELKRECYSNIVLSGGSTLFKGLEKRLKSEVCKLTNESVGIIANEKRKYLAWIGGSILSSIQDYKKQNFIHRSLYEEEGASCVHRQCPK